MIRTMPKLFAALAVCSIVWALPVQPTLAEVEQTENQNMNNQDGNLGGGATILSTDQLTEEPPMEYCGNGRCCGNESVPPETPTSCPTDCDRCGNGVCDTAPVYGENPTTCPEDCQQCGDGVCAEVERNPNHPAYCPQDCATCGDGQCNGTETAATCPQDCSDCGDGVCQPCETPQSCPADCNSCGNGQCDNGETPASCPADCNLCGNGTCETEERPGGSRPCPQDCPNTCGNGTCDNGETVASCPGDCACGDGVCNYGETATSCPNDCRCGDNICSPGENNASCPNDCPDCGDGRCTGFETPTSCPRDCGCGNGVCDAGEQNCPQDCGTCGDNRCDPARGETPQNCADCSECGDDLCTIGEDQQSCPDDCGGPEPTPTPQPTGTPPPQNCKENEIFSCGSVNVPNTGTRYACGCCRQGVEFSVRFVDNGDGTFTVVTGCGRENFGCFAPETKILMSDGSTKLITAVKVGDRVLNPITNEAMEVETTILGDEAKPLFQIGYGTQSVEVTDGHPMMVGNGVTEGQSYAMSRAIAPAALSNRDAQKAGGYSVKRADEVKVGDLVLGADGIYHRVNTVRELPVREGQLVFNLRVRTDSTNPDDHMIVADGVVTGDHWLQESIVKK